MGLTHIVPATPVSLASLLVEFAAAWARGEFPRAEDFLDRLPGDDRAARVELIYHEFCLQEAEGFDPDPKAFLNRFPGLAGPLGRVFGLHGMLDDSGDEPPELPGPGDHIGPYLLLRELGRGGLARVFLAEQADLDDRLIVLKVSRRPSTEARLLARARHPYIVEVLRHDATADGALHLISMPFEGGATLGQVLAVANLSPRRSGRDLLAALERVAAREFRATGSVGVYRDLLAHLPYAKAVAWMVARLAEALDHAESLGVTHGDLKPANILITAEARPLLLDFNLAADWRSCESSDPGGTLAYMAPERLRAVAEPKVAAIPRPRDRHRADIYALGLVLREALTGRTPDVLVGKAADARWAASLLAEARERAPARRWMAEPGLARSLGPILARCLAADPSDRYARMSHLAEDLDLWRADQPPQHAGQTPALSASLGLWLARRKTALVAGLLLLLAAGLAAGGAWAVLRAPIRQLAVSKYDKLMNSPDPTVFRGRRYGAWQAEDRGQALDSARRHLKDYGVLEPGNWRHRQDVTPLDEDDRLDLESWLLMQAWRLASLLSDGPDAPDDWARALAVLEHDPEWARLAPFEALRRDLRKRLGLSDPMPDRTGTPPRWLDQFARGLESDRDHAAAALDLYRDAIASRPGAFWPGYRAAATSSRLSDYATASRMLRSCLVRRPANPALRSQMAGCLLALGQSEPALEEANRAVDLDPDYKSAYHNRVMIQAKLGRTEALRSDLSHFARIERRGGRHLQWELKFHQAPPGGQPSEFVGLEGLPELMPDDAEVLTQVATQLHLAADRAEDALIYYDRALSADPNHLLAKYSRALLLNKLNRNEGVNEMVALIEHPRFEELVRGHPDALRIYLLVSAFRLRNGAAADARDLARTALARASRLPSSVDKETLAEIRFALARALVAGSPADPAAIAEAAKLLGLAFQDAPNLRVEKFEPDPYFDQARQSILDFWRDHPVECKLGL